jgi:shikimate dehydrogenase
MDQYYVLGNPIAHSKSPLIHARFAELTGQSLQYERLLVPLEAFAATLAQLARRRRQRLQCHRALQARGL